LGRIIMDSNILTLYTEIISQQTKLEYILWLESTINQQRLTCEQTIEELKSALKKEQGNGND